MRRIGIDVGGTNTDAVLLEDGRVVHAVKTPTTEDVTGGIVAALRAARPPSRSGARRDRRRRDRHDAFRQRRRAAPRSGAGRGDPHRAAGERLAAAVLRLAGGSRRAGARRGRSCWKAGTITTAARSCRSTKPACARRRGRSATAACASVGDRRGLLAARPVARGAGARDPRRGMPRARRSPCRTDLGRIGLLERENAALLNAALSDLARVTIAGFRDAIAASGIAAPLYLTQNDGTVMSAETAMALPVMSFASGATNSMRGAAFLSGLAGRDGGRCRRHLDRCRAIAPRLSARGQFGRRDRRGAHPLPHARPVVDRARRRQHRAADDAARGRTARASATG